MLRFISDVLPWCVLNDPRPTIVLVYTPGAVSAVPARKTFLELWETFHTAMAFLIAEKDCECAYSGNMECPLPQISCWADGVQWFYFRMPQDERDCWRAVGEASRRWAIQH